MSKLPRKIKKLSGVRWSVVNGYLYARADVGVYRVQLPGMHAFAQAVEIISTRINSKRYAAKH